MNRHGGAKGQNRHAVEYLEEPRAKTQADQWIFFTDIHFIVYDRKVMYVVKKNKQIDKLIFPKKAQAFIPNQPTGPKREKAPESDLTKAVSKITINCSRLLQVKIPLNPSQH